MCVKYKPMSSQSSSTLQMSGHGVYIALTKETSCCKTVATSLASSANLAHTRGEHRINRWYPPQQAVVGIASLTFCMLEPPTKLVLSFLDHWIDLSLQRHHSHLVLQHLLIWCLLCDNTELVSVYPDMVSLSTDCFDASAKLFFIAPKALSSSPVDCQTPIDSVALWF